jgi:hypothetical protein
VFLSFCSVDTGYVEGSVDDFFAQDLCCHGHGYSAAPDAAEPAAPAVLPVRVRVRHLHARGSGHRHHHRLHHGGQHRRLDLRRVHGHRHRGVRVRRHQPPAHQGLQARQQSGRQPPFLALGGCRPRHGSHWHRHDLGLITCHKK